MSRKKSIVALVLIMCLGVIICIHFGKSKVGFHVDELLSMYFVSDVGQTMISEGKDGITYLNEWHTGDYYKEMVSIEENERFDIIGTYNSAVKDVHPPVYYILFGLFTSLGFAGEFSKWPGIIMNIIFYCASLLALYVMAVKLLKSRIHAILVVAFYGLSVGAISNVMLIRMYTVDTFFSILFSIACVCIWEKLEQEEPRGGKDLKNLIFVGFAFFLGFMTHYYFIIFAFFMSIIMWTYILFLKKYKLLIEYAITMAGAIVLSCVFYPEIYNDIFEDYRGVEAIENAFVISGWIEAVGAYFKTVNDELFGGLLKLILLVCILCLIVFLFLKMLVNKFSISEKGIAFTLEYNKIKILPLDIEIKRNTIILFQNAFATICYILVVAKVAPRPNDRYIFIVYPFVVLTFIAICKYFTDKISKNIYIKASIWILLAFLCIAASYKRAGVNYLYKENAERMDMVSEHKNCPALLVTKNNRRGASIKHVQYLMLAEKVYPVDESGIDSIKTAMSECNTDEVMMYLDNAFEEETDDVLEKVMGYTGMKNKSMLFETELGQVYYLNK